MTTPLHKQILVDELEYTSLKRFFLLDTQADQSNKQWPLWKTNQWLDEMDTLRQGLLNYYKSSLQHQNNAGDQVDQIRYAIAQGLGLNLPDTGPVS